MPNFISNSVSVPGMILGKPKIMSQLIEISECIFLLCIWKPIELQIFALHAFETYIVFSRIHCYHILIFEFSLD